MKSRSTPSRRRLDSPGVSGITHGAVVLAALGAVLASVAALAGA